MLLCGSLLCGCASVPPVNAVLNRTEPAPATVVGPRGPLSSAQTEAILDRLRQQSQGSDLLARHLAIEQALVETPLIAGNRTTLLHDGPATFRAMFAAIRSAKHDVLLEYYIFENVAIDGEKLGDLLAEKRSEGVQVAVIYDGFGSVDTPAAFFDQLQKAGVVLLEFHPLNPLNARTGYAPNDRDHRKILVVDGITAIVGGVNLYTAYQPHPHNRLIPSNGGDPNTWHDLDLEIEGPAARQLQQIFLDHWAAEQGPPLPPLGDFPKPQVMGSEVVRIIGSDHSDTIPRYDAALLSAIRSAANTIWLTTAYFVPTKDEMRDLEAAARRGVDVRLMLPGRGDSALALAVGHSDYGGLLEAGVKIYELQDGLLHSKCVVIDDVWSTIGSSNFDHRSILFNDEVDAIVLGHATAQQLEAQFERDETHARLVTLGAWKQRPLGERIREFYSRLLEELL
ncbi:MAG TPA: phospholipase D-like domain-containing protein [Stellaceae bacterium]|nr:phospholipase D-like domain-containing protein [Stellaceae bacterium]